MRGERAGHVHIRQVVSVKEKGGREAEVVERRGRRRQVGEKAGREGEDTMVGDAGG